MAIAELEIEGLVRAMHCYSVSARPLDAMLCTAEDHHVLDGYVVSRKQFTMLWTVSPALNMQLVSVGPAPDRIRLVKCP